MNVAGFWPLQVIRKALCGLLILGILLGLLGCPGGGGGTASSQQVGVTISSANASLPPRGTQTYSASVTGTTNQTVTWTIKEGAAGGTITSTGVYTAPALAGVYHVVATSVAAPAQSAEQPVTVHLVISINASNTLFTINQSQKFTATVVGSADATVNWKIQEAPNGGAIATNGTYTAPDATGTFHIVATSQADPTQSATVAVTVQAGSASATIQ